MLTARQFVTTGLVALTIAGTALATASQAEARNNFGRGLAAGLAGAVVGGTLLAGAAHAHGYNAPAYVPSPYGPPPYAYTRGPVVSYYPSCHVVWRQDGWGDMYRTRVCN
jgi:hypothetical protein